MQPARNRLVPPRHLHLARRAAVAMHIAERVPALVREAEELVAWHALVVGPARVSFVVGGRCGAVGRKAIAAVARGGGGGSGG